VMLTINDSLSLSLLSYYRILIEVYVLLVKLILRRKRCLEYELSKESFVTGDFLRNSFIIPFLVIFI